MKVKLDENLPVELGEILARLGHDADTVAEEGLRGRVDEDVWLAAQTAGRLFVTQDLDFSDLRRFRPGTHQGVVLIRLRNPGRAALLDRLTEVLQAANLDEWAGCFVVVGRERIRIVRPRPAPRPES